jgi:preprotein translocase subunit SecF
MFIVNHRRFFYGLSTLLLVASIVAITKFGLPLSIDFRGGSLYEVEYSTVRPSHSAIQAAVAKTDANASIRETGEKGFIMRMVTLTPEHRASLDKDLATLGTFSTKRFDSIGPVLGAEAARKSFIALILVLLAIIAFVAFAFREVSQPIRSSAYGVIAVIALLHDVFIPAGAFAVLGHFFGYEVDTLFVTALLVILGFSVHDTIVVFDRVRETLRREHRLPFAQLVGQSVSQTITRSINTSLTTLLALLALYVFGGVATRPFTLTLIIGIIAGTYSSICIASPLLVSLYSWQEHRKSNKKK